MEPIIYDTSLPTAPDAEKYSKMLPAEANIAASMLSLIHQSISFTIEVQLTQRDFWLDCGFTAEELDDYRVWHEDNEAYKDALDLIYQSLPYHHLRWKRRS